MKNIAIVIKDSEFEKISKDFRALDYRHIDRWVGGFS